MHESKLIELGYTPAQASVLEAIIKLGEAKAGAIITATALQSSVVYNAIRQLEEIGLITRIKNNHATLYLCPDVKQVERLAQKTAIMAHEASIALAGLAALHTADTLAQVFYGWDGLESAYSYALVRNKTAQTRYFAVPSTWLTPRARLFFEHIDVMQKDAGQQVRGLAHVSERPTFKSYVSSKIRFCDIAVPSGTVIIGSCLLIINLIDKPRAILIDSQPVASIYQTMWDSLWNRARQ